MAAVAVKGVRKSFGANEVIHGVDLDIADGEFVALVGPSGCGKSTLLRMVAGLEDPSAGEIVIGGRVVNRLAPKDRDVAMVFQSYALYPHKTVFDNMAFGLRLRRMPTGEIESRVRSVARSLRLEEYLSRLPKELSGGQRQRVAMGRAIVRAPQVFLFDEPLSNLDARLRAEMRVEIKSRHQSLKTTTIYVTHDQIEAMTMADRIVVMNAGNVEQIGTAAVLYDRPVNTFVAGFIGSPAMNLLPGRLAADGTGVMLDAGIGLALDAPAGTPAGAEVLLGLRPEQIEIRQEGGAPATVDLVEPTGAMNLVHVRLGDAPVCMVVDRRIDLQPGERILVGPRAGAVHLFDRTTGRRIDAPAPHHGP